MHPDAPFGEAEGQGQFGYAVAFVVELADSLVPYGTHDGAATRHGDPVPAVVASEFSRGF